jgi:TonB family protein
MKWLSVLALTAFVAAHDFEPARFQSGSLIPQSPMTVGGGEVLLELDVNASGSVAQVTTLKSTPPFTAPLREAVRQWRFSPAREISAETAEREPVDSKVLVAAVFRAPALYDAPTWGEVPEELASPSEDVPVPSSLAIPPYPPSTYYHLDQTVLVEVEVDDEGKVTGTRMLRTAEGLNEVSRETAARWKFRPARRYGEAVPSVAYIVFGFRAPIISSRRPS